VLGNGITLEAANVALAARGAAPLMNNSKEAAELAKSALMSDEAFRAAYIAGDKEAVAALFQADLRVSQSSGKLTDRPVAPSDYKLPVAQHMPDASPANVQSYSDELSKLAASIQLPKESAAALTDAHFDAVRREATSTPDERSMFAQQQTTMLHTALGPDAEARIRAASDTLSKASGRTLDLSKIVNTNGASVALNLLFQAEVLAKQRK